MRRRRTGSKGRDFSSLSKKGSGAKTDEICPASLFNYNMLSYQDLVWAEHFVQVPHVFEQDHQRREDPDLPQERLPISPSVSASAASSMADIAFRAISGRRISIRRLRSQGLLAKNDVELYDLQEDPDEMRNLAMDPKKNTSNC